MADLAVRGGLVFAPDGPRPADVLVGGGLVEAVVEPGLGEAQREVAAHGLWVLPGGVDAHVHSRDPGFPDKEDWSSLTAAAAAGGVTTVADMPNTVPCVDRAEVLAAKVELAEGRAQVDFALWGIARAGMGAEAARELVEAGAVGLKAYLGYSIDRATGEVRQLAGGPAEGMEPPPSYDDLVPVAQELARLGSPLAVHAEDARLLRASAREVGSYADLLLSRPSEAEAEAVRRLGRLSEQTSAEIRIVHLASAAGLEALVAARARDAHLTAETCPQYLCLSDADAEVLGTVMKMFPLVRTAADRAAIRAGLLSGLIGSVGTDHAPHTDAEKLGRSWAEAAAGSPGVQTLYLSCLDLAQGYGRPELAVSWASSNPARELGIYPRKGVIQPGSDADLVLVDPDGTTEIQPEAMRSRQRHGVFEGTRFAFAIVRVFLRGEAAGEARGRLVRPARP